MQNMKKVLILSWKKKIPRPTRKPDPEHKHTPTGHSTHIINNEHALVRVFLLRELELVQVRHGPHELHGPQRSTLGVGGHHDVVAAVLEVVQLFCRPLVPVKGQ